MGILTYQNTQFYLDGTPYTVLSGAMHYFRIPREYWYDRLLKLKECGFNTVETYTCWNLHEAKEGVFDFSGNLDIEAYIDTAAELGLNVILRPGPYICAEWDLGGLPSWLLTYENMPLRCYDEVFLSKVRRYYAELLGRIRSRLAVNGGNIFMLQIENEYGSYGNDHRYMKEIAEIYRENDIDCLFFTSDGPTLTMLSGGSLEDFLCVGNFGSHPKENFETMKNYREDQPLMCGEYWCGWFDHWGEEHHVRPADEIVDNVREFVCLGASFNFYMFHGGTNFGFMNGANYDKVYAPTVTSYDYNAPLSESGDRTETYYCIRDAIMSHFDHVPELTAKDSEKAAYGKITLTEVADLFENINKISEKKHAPAPKFMEEIGQDFGYTLYSTTLCGPVDGWELSIDKVHDRAQVFVNGELRGIFERWNSEKPKINIPLKKGECAELSILCENMGRVNYGPRIRDMKGIKGVRFGNQYHFGWDMYPLDMRDISALDFKNVNDNVTSPSFLRGKLHIEGAPQDTFLRLDNFTKGFVTVNGINIGRYFTTAGPQKTLYVPAPFLKEGDNEIIVFESDKSSSLEIEFTDKADLG